MGKADPSGMIVYEPQVKNFDGSSSSLKASGMNPKLKLAATVVAVLVVGGGVGYFVARNKEEELLAAKKELAAEKTATKTEKDRADGVAQQVAVLTKDKASLEQELTAVRARAGEVEKQAAESNATAEKKLQAAIDKDSGTVSSEGEEIHLQLVDKVLFDVGDDKLTDKGRAVLGKVGKALKEMDDKQIWVQGHTDDQPIVVPKVTKKTKKDKDATEPTGPRFASNWELSAARSLQVVHYLQDTARIDPKRLAALAFSQYRPVSKANKAANRRIEIVLYPYRAVIEKKRVKH